MIPNSWKHATIIPLKKCGNSTDVNNLRPIFLLPLQGKILEKLVHKRLLNHMETNNLLDQNQGGFRPNHSTTDTIIKFSDKIYRRINEGEMVIATFIDLKKAFDTVNHNILIQKLDRMGIKNRNLTWIRNYLTGRSQSTLANGCLSSTKLITCGVPQGSVLGPMLFLAYINDLSNVLHFSNHYLYVDDTVIYKSGLEIQNILPLLQNDLNSFGTWCDANKLTINTKKTNYVIFGTRYRLSKVRHCMLKLQNDVLNKTTSYKYLGVHIDSHLNFNTHIDKCCKIVSHKLYLLSKLRHNITENTCIRIYKSMIIPLLEYGDTIYAGTSQRNLSRLQKLQNRALRICLNAQGYLSRIQLHLTCNVSPLNLRRKMNLRKYMFRQKENEDIVIDRNIRTRRHKAVVYETCIPNLELFKKGTIYRGIVEWNDLSAQTRNIVTYDAFKSEQKQWLENCLPLIDGNDF